MSRTINGTVSSFVAGAHRLAGTTSLMLRLPGCCMHADGAAGNITGALAANWGDIPVVLRNKPWPALQRTGDHLGAACSPFPCYCSGLLLPSLSAFMSSPASASTATANEACVAALNIVIA